MSEWRLCSDITAFVTLENGVKCVYLADSSKKKYLDQAKKNIPVAQVSGATEKKLQNEGFRLKFKGEDFMVSQAELGETWYVVKNIHAPLNTLKSLVPYTTITEGEFSEEFEIMFSDGFPGVFKPISTTHPGYQEAMKELRRRINCEMCTKTKKWKPGYRYDTMSGTIYYLGQFWSHREDAWSGRFEKIAPRPVYFFVTELYDTEKTISEVLKNRILHKEEGENIVREDELGVLGTMGPRVEVGQFLVDDISEDFDLWEALVDSYTAKTQIKYSKDSQKTRYDKPGSFWAIFDYTMSSSFPTMSPELSEKVRDVVKTGMLFGQVEFYGSNYYGTELETSDKKTEDENIAAAEKLYIRNIPSENSLRKVYFPELISALGIDLPGIAKEVLFDLVKVRTEITSIQGMLDYEVRLRRVDNSRFKRSWISTPSSNDDLTFYPDTLRDALLEFIGYLIDNYGLGVEKFSIYNTGTKARPREVVSTVISLPDLIRHLGGIDKLSEQLKEDIVGSGFYQLEVEKSLDYFKKTE
jgi:hypothetical protein